MIINIKNKKVSPPRLLAYGFADTGDGYVYHTDIADGQFTMTVTAARDGTLSAEVIDKDSGDEYILHLLDDATGTFVGRVREEYATVLEGIVAACCEEELYRMAYTKRLFRYIAETYGDTAEYLWPKAPDCCIWRRKDSKKWYALLMTVPKRKLGLDTDDVAEVLNLRMRPEDAAALIDNTTIFPGWHMNKRSWMTVLLDGSVDFAYIIRLLDDSCRLASGKPPIKAP